MKSKLNSITQAQGVFSNCGPGVDAYELSYNCRGPGCTAISGFQNVICNSDSHGMTCSNNVKCPGGTSSLQSNFTFGQNELDPWSPNWANQEDVLVLQQQDIAVSNCAHFSLRSDGTRDGTQIDVGDMTGDQTCSRPQSRPQKSPVAMAEEGAEVSTLSPGQGKDAIATVRPKLQQSSKGAKMTISISTVLSLAILTLLMFSPGAHAVSSNLRQEKGRERAEVRVREVSDKVKAFANDFGDSLANIVKVADEDGENYANNLVAGVVISICDGYYQGKAPSQFSPTVVQDCVKSVYGGETAALPASQFLAVFGASLLCNYLVSEAYPVAKEFVLSGCEELQELADKQTNTLSALTSIPTTPTISTTTKNMIENLFETSMESGNFAESSPTPISSRAQSSRSISRLASSAFKSPKSSMVTSSSTQSLLTDSVSRLSSISQNFRTWPQSLETSINSRRGSTSSVVQSPRSSRTVSSSLLFAQLATSGETKYSSSSSLSPIPVTSTASSRVIETTGVVIVSTPDSKSSTSTLSSIRPASLSLIIVVSTLPATSDIMRAYNSSSMSATTSQDLLPSSLGRVHSVPDSISDSGLLSSTHMEILSPSTFLSSTSHASTTLPLNISSQAVIQTSSQRLILDDEKATPTPPRTISASSSPSISASTFKAESELAIPSLIDYNSTTKPISNWTFSNTVSYATFPQTTPTRSKNLIEFSSPIFPLLTATQLSTPSHALHNSTQSSLSHPTSTMAFVQVPAVQTVRVTKVVVVVEASTAAIASDRRVVTGGSSTITTQPATKTYEGAGGFIAKGFNGLW